MSTKYLFNSYFLVHCHAFVPIHDKSLVGIIMTINTCQIYFGGKMGTGPSLHMGSIQMVIILREKHYGDGLEYFCIFLKILIKMNELI